jgi:hypothetical protein
MAEILHQEQPFYMEYHKMTKSQIKEYNCETQEEIIRDATAAEIAQMAKDKAEADARKAEAETKATAKAALLDKLGITAEEAVLLLS